MLLTHRDNKFLKLSSLTSARQLVGSMSLIIPQLVDSTGTSQKRDSNKTFGEPSLSEDIISALAFENNSAILFVSDFKLLLFGF